MLVLVSFKYAESIPILENAVYEFCRLERLSYSPPEIVRDRGKPVLTNLPLHISLTHSKDITAAAVSYDPVGIDIEYKKPIDCEAVAKRFFDVIPESPDEFFKLWTAKEAYAKALNIPLVPALKHTDYSRVTSFDIIKDYALSVWGDKDIYFITM